MPTCPVCKQFISLPGIHMRCHAEGMLRRESDIMVAKLDRVEIESKRKIAARVKHWHKDMGIEELERLFPDMKERV